MQSLIPIVNKLRDVFDVVGGQKLELPQIVVVGSQSCGKSSVIENLVGRDFIPRGTGIVTRRPLHIHLINNKGDDKVDSELTEWGEFTHLPGKVFTEFRDIRNEISRETDRLVGKNKAISSAPIILKITSPSVLDCMVIDLPGLTQVPVGDQPKDIGDQIRSLILSYISKSNTIILAVSSGNSDIANSDSLKLARMVDHDGNRTVGIITKLDMLDKGTDVIEILKGNLVPLKHGYIAVVNRSQQEIIRDKSIEQALRSEKAFFESHTIYSLMEHKCGTPSLVKTLNTTLLRHIRSKLPEIKLKINQKLLEFQQDLDGLSKLTHYNSQGALLLDIITRFSNGFKDCMEGGKTEHKESIGGAKIYQIFYNTFANNLVNMKPLDGLDDESITIAIRNATGTRTPLFVPEIAFEILVKRQISRLEDPSVECVRLVYLEIHKVFSYLEDKELSHYQNLRERISVIVQDLLQKYLAPCEQMINNLLKIEYAYINTNHDDFVGLESIKKILENTASSQDSLKISQKSSPLANCVRVSENGRKDVDFEVNLIKLLLESYFNIVRKNVSDIVPKTIMLFLVNKLQNCLHNELVSQLFKEENFDALLSESRETLDRRKKCESLVETLTKAKNLLKEIRENDLI